MKKYYLLCFVLFFIAIKSHINYTKEFDFGTLKLTAVKDKITKVEFSSSEKSLLKKI